MFLEAVIYVFGRHTAWIWNSLYPIGSLQRLDSVTILKETQSSQRKLSLCVFNSVRNTKKKRKKRKYKREYKT